MGHGSLRHLLRNLASSLGDGEQGRFVCPGCGGGDTKEKSLVITAYSHHIVYHCFRAKCGVTGALSTTGEGRTQAKPKARPRPYGGALVRVPLEVWEQVFAKYDISQAMLTEQGITFATEINRVRFPIYNYMGYVIGENLRAISPEQKPKSLVNKFNDVPLLHFPYGQFWKGALVLVEDQVSAIKISKIHLCASLMGTNLSDSCLKQLLMLGIKKVILMLDGDDAGFAASIKLAKQLVPFVEVVRCVLPKGKDPKDMPLGYLKEMLNV